jgi:RNA polymerase sigma-70 factor (ECF subfamily)
VEQARENEWSSLLRAANGGDAAAYQSFLKLMLPVLRISVSRSLARARMPAVDSEDIVQEVLLAVHLKRQTWIETAPVAPWIFTIARHKTIDALRRRGRRIELPVDDFADTLAAASPEPNLASVNVDRYLADLPTGQRKVVQRIAVDGQSIAETAAALAMTQGAVRVALHRGLARLAAKLSDNQ